MKIKIKTTFKIYPKQINFFPIQNFSIRNMYIWSSFKLVKLFKLGHIFSAFATKWLVENQWNIFSIDLCRLFGIFFYFWRVYVRRKELNSKQCCHFTNLSQNEKKSAKSRTKIKRWYNKKQRHMRRDCDT